MAKTSAKPASAAASTAPGDSPNKLRWALGWIVGPGLIIAALFLAGVHVGARHPNMWLSRALLWAMSAEAQVGPASPTPHESLGQRLRMLALPSTGYSLQSSLSEAQLAKLVADGAGPSVAELDCASVCEMTWTAAHADRAFISAERCELTPATTSAPASIECDARVQRK